MSLEFLPHKEGSKRKYKKLEDIYHILFMNFSASEDITCGLFFPGRTLIRYFDMS